MTKIYGHGKINLGYELILKIMLSNYIMVGNVADFGRRLCDVYD